VGLPMCGMWRLEHLRGNHVRYVWTYCEHVFPMCYVYVLPIMLPFFFFVQAASEVLKCASDGDEDSLGWMVQPYIPSLADAEYRVTLIGKAGSSEEDGFPVVTGWTHGFSSGRGVDRPEFQQMMGVDDFYVPSGRTGSGVTFDNQLSNVSRQLMLKCAKRVRREVVELVGKNIAECADGVLFRVDMCRLVMDIPDLVESTHTMFLVNEPNGIVLAANICIDAMLYPGLRRKLSSALSSCIRNALRA
jgi:hypothetical protein